MKNEHGNDNSGNWPKDEDQSTKEYDMTNHGLMRKDDCSTPRLIGVGRVDDNDHTYLISFDKRLTNSELADIHDEIHRYLQARGEMHVGRNASLRMVRKPFDPTQPMVTKDHLF